MSQQINIEEEIDEEDSEDCEDIEEEIKEDIGENKWYYFENGTKNETNKNDKRYLFFKKAFAKKVENLNFSATVEEAQKTISTYGKKSKML